MSTPKKTNEISDLDMTIFAVKFLIDEVEDLKNRIEALEECENMKGAQK